MKSNTRFYRTHVVTKGDSMAFHMVVVYNLDSTDEYSGYEFYRLVFTTDDTKFSIPSDRQATFKEELRVLDQAAHATQGGKSNDEDVIEAKMYEAYGQNAEVTIEEVKP